MNNIQNLNSDVSAENGTKPNVRRGFFSAMIDCHNFFVKETPSFIGTKQKWRIRKTWNSEIHEQYYPLTFSQKMKYPFVYIKFMYWMAKDYFNWRRSQNHA
jgi:hypothetical protein